MKIHVWFLAMLSHDQDWSRLNLITESFNYNSLQSFGER